MLRDAVTRHSQSPWFVTEPRVLDWSRRLTHMGLHGEEFTRVRVTGDVPGSEDDVLLERVVD
jgi:hypothetical protein